MTEYPISRRYADARVTRIYGGTTEIMKSVVVEVPRSVTDAVAFVLASASPARLGDAARRRARPGGDRQRRRRVEHRPPNSPRELVAGARRREGWPRSPLASTATGARARLRLDARVRRRGAAASPESAEAAVERWRAMRGRSGVLHTGHCPARADRTARSHGRRRRCTSPTSPTPRSSATSRTGEPPQVAGAFTIDGLGGWFVERHRRRPPQRRRGVAAGRALHCCPSAGYELDRPRLPGVA